MIVSEQGATGCSCAPATRQSQIFVATVPGTATPQVGGTLALTPDQPMLGEGQYTGQIQRDDDGTLLQYEWHGADGFDREPPAIFYQVGTRSFAEDFGAFTAPANPNNLVVDLLHEDLCSLQVYASAPDAADAMVGLAFKAESGSGQTLFRSTFASNTESDETDPTQAIGYIVSGGTLIGEALVRADVSYTVTGTALFANGTVGSFGPVAAPGGNGSCGDAVLPVTVVEPTSTISGTFFFQQDPIDAAADAGVRMDYYRIGVFSADGGYASGTESFFTPGNVPVSYSLAVPQGAYAFGEGSYSPQGSQIRMRWEPGNQYGGVDGVNFSPDAGIWSPLVAPGDTNPYDLGISPDGFIYVPDNQSNQTVNLNAQMSFIDGTVSFTGCQPGALSGSAQVAAPDNLGGLYTGQDGQQHALVLDATAGSAFGPIFANGTYEIATFPGPWDEYIYFLSVSNGTDISAPDFYSENLNIIPDDSRAYAVAPGRANAVQSNRTFAVSAVTVVLRVKNQDGSFRPFTSPSASIDFPTDPDESFGITAQRGDGLPLSPIYTLRMLVPVSTVNIVPHALVPENPDGTGTQTETDFPALTNVQIPAPTAAGACSAVCIDSLTGQQYTDDSLPPAIALSPALPATTTSATLALAGTLTDTKPILSATLNGQPLTLGAPSGSATPFATTLTLTPGNNAVALAASDACNEMATQTGTVRYLTPPVLAEIPAQTVLAGDALTFTATATDADGDVPTLSASPLPTGATFTGGVFAWTPTASQAGLQTVTVTASASGLTASEDVAITVTVTPPVVHHAPTLAPIAPIVTHVGTPLTFTLVTTNPDGDALTCTAAPLPATAALTGFVFTWTPLDRQAGDYTITFTCTNTAGLSASTQASITVVGNPSNCACATADPGDLAGFFMLLAIAYRRRKSSSEDA